ncbi:MAG TPA: DUF2442 domain-containing protein [Acidobacteriaceae bacterium]
MTSEKELERAEKRGQETYDNVPHAIEATYVPSIRRLLILLSNGLEISLRQDEFATFRNASPSDLETIELNAEGFEIHFPKIDEGFWIPDLLEHLLGVRKFLGKAAEEEMAEYREKRVA